MRPLASLLAAFVLALVLSPAPAVAAPGGAPGQAKKVDASTPPGQAKPKPTPPGQAKKNVTTPPAAPLPSIELDNAQRALESKQALPLARIVAVAESRSNGHVIDAQLLTVDGVLLYRLTLLDQTGRSWREFYVARTGKPVNL